MKNMIPKSVKGIENTTLLPLPFDGEQNLHLSSLFFPSKTKGSPEPKKAIQEGITEDGDENEDDEGRTIYPYERLTTTAEDPVTGIDVTQREVSNWISRFSSHSCTNYWLPLSEEHDTYCYCPNADISIVS
jgi:hypothetical protein